MTPLNHSKLHPGHEPRFAHYPSRRSTVFSAKGAVATSQALGTKRIAWVHDYRAHGLACQAGIEILNKGGNAADAAVATAAAMNVCEPSATGIGGDIFCLFYDATTKTVRGINGSGRSPAALTLEYLCSRGIKGDTIPLTDINSVTVPGAAAGWTKTVEEFGSGRLGMQEILAPAIRMAREGVPTQELCSEAWQLSEKLIKSASPNAHEMLAADGRAPQPSQIITHPELAETFQAIAAQGKEGFYTGRIAESIVKLVQDKGGVMTLDDLAACKAEVVDPIKYDFRAGDGDEGESEGEADGDGGVTLWECPPNGQGLTALIALGIIEALEKQHDLDILSIEHNSALYLHILIEALRLAFAAKQYISDPSHPSSPDPTHPLLSPTYLASRARLISLSHTVPIAHGNPHSSSDTIYLATADSAGNSCSFIASNYAGFGTGAIPAGCGFTLQNRGSGFTLREGHPNCVEGGKRPFHTIIPGMVTHTRGGELLMSFGVMGGFMQPQGHVQVLLNKLRGHSAQASLDAPRFCISAGQPDAASASSASAGDIDSEIWLEEGIAESVGDELAAMGHAIKYARDFGRKTLGRGQIIQQVIDPSGRRVWACGSDLRGDGHAVGQI